MSLCINPQQIYAMSFWSINLCIHLTEDNITNNAYASTGIKNVAVFFSAFSQFVLVEDLIYKHVLELLIQQQIWHLGLLTVNLKKKKFKKNTDNTRHTMDYFTRLAY